MIRFTAFASVLALASSAQAMSPAPLHQADGVITQVRQACGVGQVRINGICCTGPPPARSAEAPANVWHGVKAFAVNTSDGVCQTCLSERL